MFDQAVADNQMALTRSVDWRLQQTHWFIYHIY